MAEGLLSRLGGRKHASEKEFAVALGEKEWRRKLSPAQYRVLREHGTERAGSSPLDKEYSEGIYHCAGCGQPLFASDTKFNSGTGWPSFSERHSTFIAARSSRHRASVIRRPPKTGPAIPPPGISPRGPV
jgi:hypothetical protein